MQHFCKTTLLLQLKTPSALWETLHCSAENREGGKKKATGKKVCHSSHRPKMLWHELLLKHFDNCELRLIICFLLTDNPSSENLTRHEFF